MFERVKRELESKERVRVRGEYVRVRERERKTMMQKLFFASILTHE